jgi:uncharacterized protein YggE
MTIRAFGLIASVALLPAAGPAFAQARLLAVDNARLIEVSGEASVSAKPDFARVTLGVATTGKDARDAAAANAKAVDAFISLIKGEGVAPADIQTSSLSISPEFSNPAPNASAPPTIVGYNVMNAVTVTVRDLSRLGALIDKAVGAGANAMYGISYGENDPGALLDKARPLAVADARRKAEIYANAAGAGVGRLMMLTEQPGASPPQFRRAYAQNMAAAAPTPVEPGEDKLTVAITAQFELTP